MAQHGLAGGVSARGIKEGPQPQSIATDEPGSGYVDLANRKAKCVIGVGSLTRSIAMASKRKLISFDPETWLALDLLSHDSGKDLQALADEAFADLLIKHRRPRQLNPLQRSSRAGQGVIACRV